MKYFEFSDITLPLSCITGFSYSKNGNIVPTSKLSYVCNGINPLQVQVQISLNQSVCIENNFIDLARKLSKTLPDKSRTPSHIVLGGNVILPQMLFMLTNTNITYQSDRLGNLQEMQISWTLSGTKVSKDENRELSLALDNTNNIPRVAITCKGKSIKCSQDINICALNISAFKGHLEILLADTYTRIDRNSWLRDLIESDDSYVTIENYGKWFIQNANIVQDNWFSIDITKFNKEWLRKDTNTYISSEQSSYKNDKLFSLNDIFTSANVKSKAMFKYLKHDMSKAQLLYELQDSLGYLIGTKIDEIVIYDVPVNIPKGDITYDYILDTDTTTKPITKVVLRDGVNEYVKGDNTGETFLVNTICSVTENAAESVLRYANFNRNMIVMTLPYEPRVHIGSIITIKTDGDMINTVCTEYDIDFLNNTMCIELHYVAR